MRGSSIPETAEIEPKSRGVLDRPVEPDDDGLWIASLTLAIKLMGRNEIREVAKYDACKT
jgi:hypothetical protein